MTTPVYKDIGTGHETTPVIPTHAAGDFLLLCTSHANVGTTMASPGGGGVWIKSEGSPFEVDDTEDVILNLFYLFAPNSSVPNPTLSAPGSSYTWGIVYTATGVNTATPIHRIASAWSVNVAPFMPGLTTLVADSLILQIAASSQDTAADIVTASANSSLSSPSFTKRYAGGSATGNGGGVLIFEGGFAAVGTVQPAILTVTPSGFLSCATIALQAADKSLPTIKSRGRIYNLGGQ